MAKKPRADLMPLANYESIFETDDKDGESRTKLCSRERWWLLFLTASILCVGCLTTYFATKHLSNKKCNLDQDNLPDHIQRDEIHKQILSEINAENLEKYLRYFSAKPHVAGSERNNELGDYIHNQFKSFGLHSEIFEYRVLLSYPNKTMPNYAYILNDRNKINYRTKSQEEILIGDEKFDDIIQPFNAFSASGNVTGDIVYANYGTEVDFSILKNHFNVNCSGKILIIRCGRAFRGDKVKLAEENGAAGVLIYMDPLEFSPFKDDRAYPNGLWLPKDGVQRGTLKIDGDVLTPGWPATADAYRLPVSEANLPKIPCQPISAQDAWNFISKIGGPAVGFSNWTGGFNITYHVGPGFRTQEYKGWKVKLVVNNYNKEKTVKNVIGTLKGKHEPDRYVLVGNHRDAWVFGAADASSGTAILLETARAIAIRSRSGWKPRRTIKFCSWDSEEPGIIGSTEWVEEFASILSNRAVGYINVDTGVVGNYSLFSRASPLMYSIIESATKKVKDPHDSKSSVFDKYLQSFPSKENRSRPLIASMGSGSDFLMFYQSLGIPSVDFTYTMKQVDPSSDRTFYPMYHSSHETFYWMKKFVDPTFYCHRASARVIASAILSLSDTSVINYNPIDYALALEKGTRELEKSLKSKGAEKMAVKIDPLHRAVRQFRMAANDFTMLVSKLDYNEFNLRILNDQIIQLEKSFIKPDGIFGQPKYIKHLVYAPSKHNSYGSSVFSGVSDLLFNIEKTKNWLEIKKQLTFITTAIKAAALSLRKD